MALTTGVLLVVAWQSASRRWLGTCLLPIAVALLAVVVDRFVVTDRELIDELLETARAAVEANDIERVLLCVDPQAREMRTAVSLAMSAVVISNARIADDKISIQANGQVALAEFIGKVQARDRKGQVPYERFVRRFTIELRKRDDRWIMTKMSMRAPFGAGSENSP